MSGPVTTELDDAVRAHRYGNVTAASLAETVSPAVRAVIVTHMWGNPCPMGEIVEFCRTHELLLLEDCSHAHFASWQGQRVGTFGDMAVFSTNQSSTNQKAITTGEGGVLVTATEIETRRRAILTRYTTSLADNPVITTAIVPDTDAQHGLYVLGLRFHPHSPGTSKTDTRIDEVAALPSPAVVLSARLNRYYCRLRRPPGSQPTSQDHWL